MENINNSSKENQLPGPDNSLTESPAFLKSAGGGLRGVMRRWMGYEDIRENILQLNSYVEERKRIRLANLEFFMSKLEKSRKFQPLK